MQSGFVNMIESGFGIKNIAISGIGFDFFPHTFILHICLFYLINLALLPLHSFFSFSYKISSSAIKSNQMSCDWS